LKNIQTAKQKIEGNNEDQKRKKEEEDLNNKGQLGEDQLVEDLNKNVKEKGEMRKWSIKTNQRIRESMDHSTLIEHLLLSSCPKVR
jgi:hypothetical protein